MKPQAQAISGVTSYEDLKCHGEGRSRLWFIISGIWTFCLNYIHILYCTKTYICINSDDIKINSFSDAFLFFSNSYYSISLNAKAEDSWVQIDCFISSAHRGDACNHSTTPWGPWYSAEEVFETQSLCTSNSHILLCLGTALAQFVV